MSRKYPAWVVAISFLIGVTIFFAIPAVVMVCWNVIADYFNLMPLNYLVSFCIYILTIIASCVVYGARNGD